MKVLVVFIMTVSLVACSNSAKECRGMYIKVDTSDSICLNLYTDVDTTQIKDIAKKTKDRVLLIFTGFSTTNRDIVSEEIIKNNEDIKEQLSNLTIIKLNVDNKSKRNVTDSNSIGYSNIRFQIDRFKWATEPYHIFIDKDLKVVGDSLPYTRDTKEILEFLSAN